jgi:hypothetical protein
MNTTVCLLKQYGKGEVCMRTCMRARTHELANVKPEKKIAVHSTYARHSVMYLTRWHTQHAIMQVIGPYVTSATCLSHKHRHKYEHTATFRQPRFPV